MSQPAVDTRYETTTQTAPTLAEVAATTALRFSAEERSLMREMYCQGAPESEFRQLCAIAEARGLSPLRHQCHFVERWNDAQKRKTWAVQISIDGMRGQAESTGLMDGSGKPIFTSDQDGRLVTCEVAVWRKGCSRPFVSEVWFAEYCQLTRDGKPTRSWANMPHVMLGKCAEAAALRKAFPLPLGGLYTPEEMGQSENAERSHLLAGAPAAPPPAQPPLSTVETTTAASRVVESVEDAGARVARQVEAMRAMAHAESLADLKAKAKAFAALDPGPRLRERGRTIHSTAVARLKGERGSAPSAPGPSQPAPSAPATVEPPAGAGDAWEPPRDPDLEVF